MSSLHIKYKYAKNAITVTSHNSLLDCILAVFTCLCSMRCHGNHFSGSSDAASLASLASLPVKLWKYFHIKEIKELYY